LHSHGRVVIVPIVTLNAPLGNSSVSWHIGDLFGGRGRQTREKRENKRSLVQNCRPSRNIRFPAELVPAMTNNLNIELETQQIQARYSRVIEQRLFCILTDNARHRRKRLPNSQSDRRTRQTDMTDWISECEIKRHARDRDSDINRQRIQTEDTRRKLITKTMRETENNLVTVMELGRYNCNVRLLFWTQHIWILEQTLSRFIVVNNPLTAPFEIRLVPKKTLRRLFIEQGTVFLFLCFLGAAGWRVPLRYTGDTYIVYSS